MLVNAKSYEGRTQDHSYNDPAEGADYPGRKV